MSTYCMHDPRSQQCTSKNSSSPHTLSPVRDHPHFTDGEAQAQPGEGAQITVWVLVTKGQAAICPSATARPGTPIAGCSDVRGSQAS